MFSGCSAADELTMRGAPPHCQPRGQVRNSSSWFYFRRVRITRPSPLWSAQVLCRRIQVHNCRAPSVEGPGRRPGRGSVHLLRGESWRGAGEHAGAFFGACRRLLRIGNSSTGARWAHVGTTMRVIQFPVRSRSSHTHTASVNCCQCGSSTCEQMKIASGVQNKTLHHYQIRSRSMCGPQKFGGFCCVIIDSNVNATAVTECVIDH